MLRSLLFACLLVVMCHLDRAQADGPAPSSIYRMIVITKWNTTVPSEVANLAAIEPRAVYACTKDVLKGVMGVGSGTDGAAYYAKFYDFASFNAYLSFKTCFEQAPYPTTEAWTVGKTRIGFKVAPNTPLPAAGKYVYVATGNSTNPLSTLKQEGALLDRIKCTLTRAYGAFKADAATNAKLVTPVSNAFYATFPEGAGLSGFMAYIAPPGDIHPPAAISALYELNVEPYYGVGFQSTLIKSSSVDSPPAAGLCAIEGPAASPMWMNASRTCLSLYSSGAPVQAPADTATVKWGQIFLMSSSPLVVVFMDRTAKTFPISASAPNLPSDYLTVQLIWSLLLVKAKLTGGNVTTFTPVLYVPYSTIMATMENTQFEGQLYNSDPRPPGPEQKSWFRWSFGHTITVTNTTQKYGTLLHGTFDNLFTPVQDSKGNCQPALCADPTRTSAACKYYMEFFGNRTRMTLSWDPNMHTQTDSELVPMFPATNRQYMSTFIELHNLMLPTYQFVPKEYVFISHGNPMGVPQNFTGLLRPATPLVNCVLA